MTNARKLTAIALVLTMTAACGVPKDQRSNNATAAEDNVSATTGDLNNITEVTDNAVEPEKINNVMETNDADTDGGHGNNHMADDNSAAQ